MTIRNKIVITVCGLLAVGPVGEGVAVMHEPRQRELRIGQPAAGTVSPVPVEVVTTPNGAISFRIGPFDAEKPLVFEYAVPQP